MSGDNIQDLLDMETLSKLKELFFQSGEGDPELSTEEFIHQFSLLLPDWDHEKLEDLNAKIDVNCDGSVSWEEFTNFLIYYDSAQRSMEEKAFEQVTLTLSSAQPQIPLTTHRDTILFIHLIETKNLLVTYGADCFLKIWNLNELDVCLASVEHKEKTCDTLLRELEESGHNSLGESDLKRYLQLRELVSPLGLLLAVFPSSPCPI